MEVDGRGRHGIRGDEDTTWPVGAFRGGYESYEELTVLGLK